MSDPGAVGDLGAGWDRVARVTGELDVAGAARSGERLARPAPSARALVVDFTDLGLSTRAGWRCCSCSAGAWEPAAGAPLRGPQTRRWRGCSRSSSSYRAAPVHPDSTRRWPPSEKGPEPGLHHRQPRLHRRRACRAHALARHEGGSGPARRPRWRRGGRRRVAGRPRGRSTPPAATSWCTPPPGCRSFRVRSALAGQCGRYGPALDAAWRRGPALSCTCSSVVPSASISRTGGRAPPCALQRRAVRGHQSGE